MSDILCIGGQCDGAIYIHSNGPAFHGMMFRLWNPPVNASGPIPSFGPIPTTEAMEHHTYRAVKLQCEDRKWFVAVPENASDASAIEKLINFYASGKR